MGHYPAGRHHVPVRDSDEDEESDEDEDSDESEDGDENSGGAKKNNWDTITNLPVHASSQGPAADSGRVTRSASVRSAASEGGSGKSGTVKKGRVSQVYFPMLDVMTSTDPIVPSSSSVSQRAPLIRALSSAPTARAPPPSTIDLEGLDPGHKRPFKYAHTVSAVPFRLSLLWLTLHLFLVLS